MFLSIFISWILLFLNSKTNETSSEVNRDKTVVSYVQGVKYLGYFF